MSVDLKVTVDALKVGIGSALKDLVTAASEDIKASLQGEIARIAERTAELGALALAGDELAAETLRDMQAQAISEAAILEMREERRTIATAKLVAASIVKALIGVAVTAAA